jgi:hypothetical protein
MKKILLLFSLIACFTACKKSLDSKSGNNAVRDSNVSNYTYFDTSGYSTGNITGYQFQTQEIDLTHISGNIYGAVFAGAELRFTNIQSPTSWITGQSAGLFTVYLTNNTYNLSLSSAAPNFSVSGLAVYDPAWGLSLWHTKDGPTWVVSPGAQQVSTYTIPGVLVMSSYSPTHFAIMPGAYHPKEGLHPL